MREDVSGVSVDYEKAFRMKLRFPSVRGDLTLEQLWNDVPLLDPEQLQTPPVQTRPWFSLDVISQQISREMREQVSESFVLDTPSPQSELLALRMAIVLRVISVKKAEQATKLQQRQLAEEARKIEKILAGRADQALEAASEEALRARLQEIRKSA